MTDFEDQDFLGRSIHTQTLHGINCCIDEHYEVNGIIGKGAYSIVCGGVDKRTDKKVAIKKIKESIFTDEINTKRILREINILRQIKHEAVIEMLDIIPPKSRSEFSEVYIVFDRMATDLRKLIHSTTKLSLSHISYLSYQLFRALKFLHSVGVVHRDLTPANILVSPSCEIKICDFGLSRTVPEAAVMTQHVVTRWYRAPEIMCRYEYDKPVDIWAASCILAELFLRRPLFPGDHFVHQLNLIFDLIGTPSKKQVNIITNETLLSFLSRLEPRKPVVWTDYFSGTTCPEDACDLFRQLFLFDPSDRMKIEDILAHPYFEQWHDLQDEPVGTQVVHMDFEDIEDIEKIKDLLWEEIITVMKMNIEKETATEPELLKSHNSRKHENCENEK